MTWENLQKLKISSIKSGDKTRVKVLNDIIILVQKEQTKGKIKVEATEEIIDNCTIKEQKTLEEMVETCPTTEAYAERLADYKEQLKIAKEYAPQMITDETAIKQLIIETLNDTIELTAANRGQIMKIIMPILKQKHCDMKTTQQVLQSMLK